MLDPYLAAIDSELRAIVRASEQRLEPYYGMMAYHLGWRDESQAQIATSGGKRIRPLICLLACRAAGGEPSQAVPAAAAVELVHNFSLVHDDIQDQSRTRRGRRTVWDVWGPAQAINVGDGLFVLARLALRGLDARGVPAHRQLAATHLLDRACIALCEGQFFDMESEKRQDVTLEQYLWMIGHKTAALLAASAEIGAAVATDDELLQKQMASFGQNLGMAFQIQDDILGTWGDERVTGKSAATDIRDRKKTLPVVYALNQEEDRAAVVPLRGLLAKGTLLDEPEIEEVLGVLDRVGARQYAEGQAAEYYRLALRDLDTAQIDGEAAADLRQLADLLLDRAA